MEKSILCAIDFSESSIQTLQWAFDLAFYCQANLTILFSYRLIQPSPEDDMVAMKRRMESEASQKFGAFEKALINNHPVPYKFISEVGFLSDRIDSYLKKNPVSMLVISGEMCNVLSEQGFTLSGSLRVPVVVVPKETMHKLQ